MSDDNAPAATGAPARRVHSSRARWAVPGIAAVAVAAAFGTPALIATASSSDAPDVTAAELVARVADAEPQALSGTAVYTARLGLPEIPLSDVSGADPINLLGGSSTMRVWTDGQDRSRVALLGATSEYSVVADGPEAWTYSSEDDAVVHYTLDPADRARYDELAQDASAGRAPDVAGDLPTPQEAAQQVLDLARQDATVAVGAPTTVAGRDAYPVVVTPTSETTLVARVVVSVDSETSTPLRVQVWSRDDADVPALELGFTDVTFAPPSDTALEFSAPPGASERDVVVPLPPEPTPEELADAEAAGAGDGALPPGTTVTGTGWDTVVETAGVDVVDLLAADPSSVADLPPGVQERLESQGAQDLYEEFVPQDGSGPVPELDASTLYEQLTTEVPQGRLLSSALLSVLVTDDGRVLAGAVPADVLIDRAG
ncbi:LolA family protein [Cellulosimicrobium arenosum]|uniref:MucB/RseB N-terminal domain-containing protein n=1 Tax=Cellulosimicrobium arenosum TaxID=2708133 RepID=A0A927IYN0_9MICO|nr:hypothetical protein [Cellulosimicrobium arenosum]MBD8078561.1 hypothetical protein [Cellulosimicrobium arenosum]